MKKGDKIIHPRFGNGKILSIDKTTYSIEIAVIKLTNGDTIARPLSEISKSKKKT